MPNIKQIVGARVRTLRKERRLSQEALAGKAGLHTTYVGAVERGEKNVSIETLERIAGGLAVKIYDILSCLAQEEDVPRMRAYITKEIKTSQEVIMVSSRYFRQKEVPGIGIEPMTRGFSVPCSTD